MGWPVMADQGDFKQGALENEGLSKTFCDTH